MEILKLKLYATNIKTQFRFYVEHLGFALLDKADDYFKVQAGKTELTFQQSHQRAAYHFAFLIPYDLLNDAVQFLHRKKIDILPHQGSQTIDFGNGRAVYFHDEDGNIVEFIGRPGFDLASDASFSISRIIKINEIGLPVENTLEMSRQLIDRFGIRLIDPDLLSDTFCWTGDFNGAFIVTKIGRDWLPTDTPGRINDFCIEFMTESKHTHAICINDNKFSDWNAQQ